ARQAAAAGWQPAPAEGEWIPAGMPGSNWSASAENGTSAEYVGKRRAPEAAMTPPQSDPVRGRHSAAADAGDPGRPTPPPSPPQPTAPPPQPEEAPDKAPRHRSLDEAESTGGHSVAELLARLETRSSGGGRRRRRED
ncbi:MAG TPA: hypothetical protein VJR50_02190, partial [Mycobacterium sp.]|nr:hypothetical protein [Mycobacterium sp.]